MGFAAEFTTWLNALLSQYIAQTTRTLATTLEPAVITLGVLYVMIWGYLQMAGRVEEPVLEGLKRIAILAVVIGVGLDLWLYNEVIVQTFFVAPGQLAGAMIGAHDFAGTVDEILARGDAVATALLTKAGVFHGNFSFYFAAIAVWIMVDVTAIYTLFLLTLSMVALSVLLAIGPLFVPLFLFDATRRFLEAWVAQLANYAFVTVLSALVSALMLTLIDRAAAQAQQAGGGILLADAVRVCLAAGFTFLVLRQVLPMAAALSSGITLATYGIVSGSLNWARRRSLVGTSQFLRGFLLDRETSRWDPLSRKAGYALRTKVKAAWQGRENTIGRT